MTNEQIEKLANYIVYLRGRMDAYREDGDGDLVEYIGAKIEAAREVAIVFDCRDAVFTKVYEIEEKR